LHTGQGLLRVRFEIHRIEDSGEPRAVVLLRDRSRLTRGDRALLLACEALANRHALGGLVHSGKGPLNNFNLTLALLTAAITRGEGVSPDVQARSLRYVDVLRAEAGRLAHYLEEMHGLVMPRDCAPESFDIAAMLRESARTLHHGATLREIELATDVPDAPVLAFGEPEQVRLALLALTLSLIDATPAGGVVTCAIEPEESGDRVARIALSTSREGVPARLAASLFRVACTAGSDQAAAIAGRMIIEAQGGDVAIGRESTGRPAIVLGLPTRGA
jgi:signal transduction histidine kinase